MTPRTFSDCVWCSRWQACGGMFVPGYEGGGQPMLCEACERGRLAEQTQPVAAEPPRAAG